MQNKKALLAALTTYAIFGFTFLTTKLALEHVSADILLAVRFTISFVFMSFLLIIGIGKVSYRGKPLLKLLGLGFCQPVAYFTFEILGIRYTNSSFAGIIISLVPVVATLLSILFLKEKIAPKKFIWISCSVAGVSFLSYLQGSTGAIQIKGILFMLLAVLSASGFSILSRSVADKFSPFERSYMMMCMGTGVFVPYAAVTNGSEFLPRFVETFTNTSAMIPILYLSVISSVIAFMCLNYATTHLEVSKVTSFTNTQPVISLFAGVVFLHEPVSAMHLLACAFIIVGVYMITKDD